MSLEQISSGYRLEKVFAAEEYYALIADESLGEGATPAVSEGSISLGWDWRVEGPRTFDVALTVNVGPHNDRNEETRVSMVGRFVALPGELTVSVEAFITQHAPAIVMPYVREAISALTGRGYYGAFYLPPVNILRFMKDLDRSGATGFAQLREDPALAESFGITFEDGTQRPRQLPSP